MNTERDRPVKEDRTIVAPSKGMLRAGVAALREMPLVGVEAEEIAREVYAAMEYERLTERGKLGRLLDQSF